MIRQLSLRGRLLILLTLLLALLWLALEVVAFGTAGEQADAEVEAELRTITNLLTAVVISDQRDLAEQRMQFQTIQASRDTPFDETAYELVTRTGVILRSSPFPEFASNPSPGLSTVRAGMRDWRVLTIFERETGTIRRAALPKAARDLRMHDLRRSLSASWVIALPLFAIAVLGSIWLGLRPLHRIERRMSAVSPHDPEPLGLDRTRMPRELASLSRSFDELATRLARVISDQRIFASAASHELRTPLAGAISQLDVLRRAPGRQESLDKMGDALKHMERLIAQLLFLVRRETATIPGQPDKIELHELARDVLDELDLAGTVRLDGSGELEGYPDLLRSLLRNFLSNAERASLGNDIAIRIVPGSDTVAVSVLDRGPGIPEAEKERVLEPFQRGRAERTT